ncbi:MAG: leucyl/phenylalanyl-tRNA--protein transferase, partial [Gallionellaceae bacterium]|nr:leucyl/phenylalanyl-tRNA--protein transferase [Gallionellaceae bacterium]
MLRLLNNDTPFPPLTQALNSPNGLLAVGGDLSSA